MLHYVVLYCSNDALLPTHFFYPETPSILLLFSETPPISSGHTLFTPSVHTLFTPSPPDVNDLLVYNPTSLPPDINYLFFYSPTPPSYALFTPYSHPEPLPRHEPPRGRRDRRGGHRQGRGLLLDAQVRGGTTGADIV